MRRPLRSDEARGVANLAIDLGDPGRMSRARRMHRSNAVTDVEIAGGIAHATVADPGGELHDVSIAVSSPIPGGAPPTAADLEPSCTCDDDGDACTHALAALLGVAEEIEANGRLLQLWSGESSGQQPAVYEHGDREDPFFDGPPITSRPNVSLTNLRFERSPFLPVDDIDAGPVVVDAVAAVRAGLSRYRVRQ